MSKIPSYTKIITLGSSRTERALVGEVIVQEKVDGSMFRFGINEEGELVFASKGAVINPIVDEETGEITNVQKLFLPAVKHILSKKDILLKFRKGTYFYGETLYQTKHNVLKYGKTPKNNIVLFDVISQGAWHCRSMLKEFAKILDIDLIPELYRGTVTKDKLKDLLTTKSYLGEETIEGVVIKNYNENISLGGFIFPLFTKFVREGFKERHGVEWKTKKSKNNVEEFIKSFKNENRWIKALLHLKEKGLIENAPRDIGKLINEVVRDIEEEEKENIKNYLYKVYIKDIKRNSTKGLPEWYKEKLLDNLKEE